MKGDSILIWCYSVNLAYLITNLYGWLLKRFFVPNAYKENVKELYPAQRSVAQFYFLQLFEIPYLLKVGEPEVLFYVNGSGLLVFHADNAEGNEDFAFVDGNGNIVISGMYGHGTGHRDNDGLFEFYLPDDHDDTDDTPATPLGSGALLLVGFGAAYAMKKLRDHFPPMP